VEVILHLNEKKVKIWQLYI